jgi:hypothetical protein
MASVSSFALQLFQATTFDLTIYKAIAQSVWSFGFEPRPSRWSKSMMC